MEYNVKEIITVTIHADKGLSVFLAFLKCYNQECNTCTGFS